MIRFIEKRYRLRFGLGFVPGRFTWIFGGRGKVIEKSYDPLKRSFFVVRGQISISGRAAELKRTGFRERECEVEVFQVEEGGIGKVFSGEE